MDFIFGIDTSLLHWSEDVINSVKKLYDEERFGEDENRPDEFEYDDIYQFLDANLPYPLCYRDDKDYNNVYIGIAPCFVFDVPDELKDVTTRYEAARFVARAIEPFFEESFDILVELCRAYAEQCFYAEG